MNIYGEPSSPGHLPPPEDVPDVRAGNNFEGSSAHPGLEGKLEVLAAPDVESGVVGAQLLEEVLVDGEESAGHRRRPDRLRGVPVPLFLPLRDRVPVELQIQKRLSLPSDSTEGGKTYLQVPVEASDVDSSGIPVIVFQSGVVDDVDHRTHDRRSVSGYSVQQRLQPTCD